MIELSYLFYNEDGHQKEIELDRIKRHHIYAAGESLQ